MNKTITLTMGALMKILVLILLLLISSIGCFGSYNFEFGSSLANFQDAKFEQYKNGKNFSEEDRTRLEKNLWVKAATRAAPGNLPVRHYCLIDLDKGKARNKRNIRRQLDKLGDEIWREGYSYWIYVKPMLVEYSKKFGEFDFFIKYMNKKFEETAYMGADGKLYPAPFGDIRHVPLEMESQSAKPVSIPTEIYPLIIRILKWDEPELELHIDTTEYFIQKCPVGFNTHVPDTVQTIRVLPDGSVYVYTNEGEYIPFKWYEGYDKKYKNKEEEFKDTFSKNRLSVFNYKKLMKKYQQIFK